MKSCIVLQTQYKPNFLWLWDCDIMLSKGTKVMPGAERRFVYTGWVQAQYELHVTSCFEVLRSQHTVTLHTALESLCNTSVQRGKYESAPCGLIDNNCICSVKCVRQMCRVSHTASLSHTVCDKHMLLIWKLSYFMTMTEDRVYHCVGLVAMTQHSTSDCTAAI